MKDGEHRKPIAESAHLVAATPFADSPSSAWHFVSHYGLGGLLILATFLLCVFPLNDTDFWWHLRTGQLIVERGTIPRTDWFLFTDSDRPWIDLHWGFQLLMTAVYSLGGVDLVILVKATVISGAVAIAWLATGRELPDWLRVLIWIPAVICISGRAYERPEILSQLFLAAWLWIAFHAHQRPRLIWMLPLIQVVWINCHALYILGLVVGGCFAVDYLMRFLAGGLVGLERLPGTLRPKPLAAAGALCLAVSLLNPYGLTGALFPFVLQRKFSSERDIYESIGEFQRPFDFFGVLIYGYESVYLDAQIMLALLAMGSLLILLLRDRRWSPLRWLLCLGFGSLAWEATRNVNIFALVFATVAVANVADLRSMSARRKLASSKPIREPARRRDDEAQQAVVHTPGVMNSRPFTLPRALVGVVLIGWMILTVTGSWGRVAGEKKPFGLGERPAWFAHEAAKFAGQAGFPERAFIAHIGIAATYIYHNGPDRKVFLDPRLEVARPETFQLHAEILNQMARGDRRWELLLRDAQKNLPVVVLDSRGSRPSINGLLNTPGWRLVFADPAAAVFLTDRQADELNLPTADPSPLMFPP